MDRSAFRSHVARLAEEAEITRTGGTKHPRLTQGGGRSILQSWNSSPIGEPDPRALALSYDMDGTIQGTGTELIGARVVPDVEDSRQDRLVSVEHPWDVVISRAELQVCETRHAVAAHYYGEGAPGGEGGRGAGETRKGEHRLSDRMYSSLVQGGRENGWPPAWASCQHPLLPHSVSGIASAPPRLSHFVPSVLELVPTPRMNGDVERCQGNFGADRRLTPLNRHPELGPPEAEQLTAWEFLGAVKGCSWTGKKR